MSPRVSVQAQMRQSPLPNDKLDIDSSLVSSSPPNDTLVCNPRSPSPSPLVSPRRNKSTGHSLKQRPLPFHGESISLESNIPHTADHAQGVILIGEVDPNKVPLPPLTLATALLTTESSASSPIIQGDQDLHLDIFSHTAYGSKPTCRRTPLYFR